MLREMKNTNNFTLIFFAQIFLSIFAIYFIFSGAIHIPFYHHDIYKFSNGGMHVLCRPNEAGYGFLYDIARPFSAWLDCANFKLANTLTTMSYVRVGCAILIGMVMGAFAFWLNTTEFTFITAFFISGAIFCLPALQTTIVMGATNIILAIFLAFIANVLINKGFLHFRFMRKNASTYEKLIISLYICSGVGSLLASLFTYPSMSGFYLLPTLIVVLFKPFQQWLNIRGLFIRDIFIFSVSCILFFLIARHIQNTHMGVEISNLVGAYHYRINFNLIERIITLTKLISSLWSNNASQSYSLSIYLIIIISVFAGAVRLFISHFYKEKKLKSLYYLAQKIIALFILIIMGSAFYIAQPENVLLGRILFIYQAMVIIILAWSMLQISTLSIFKRNYIWAGMLGSMFFGAAVYTNYVTTKSALNDNMELNYISGVIANHIITDATKLERIHIISAAVDNFNGLPKPDDILNGNSTQYAGDITNIVNTAFLQFAEKGSFNLTNCIFSESEEERHISDEVKCIKSAHKDSITVTYSRPGKAFYKSPHMLVIDMNTLAPFAGLSKLDMNK